MPLLLTTILFVLRISWYDPSLCTTQPINCFDPTNPYTMAAGDDARDWYGRALACPLEFPIGTRFTLSRSWHGLSDGEWLCLDRGGAVVTESSGIVRVDLLVHEPIWNELLLALVEP